MWLVRQEAEVVDSECICSLAMCQLYSQSTLGTQPLSQGVPISAVYPTASLKSLRPPASTSPSWVQWLRGESIWLVFTRSHVWLRTGSLWIFFPTNAYIRHYNVTPMSPCRPAGLGGCMRRVMAWTNQPVLLKTAQISAPNCCTNPLL